MDNIKSSLKQIDEKFDNLLLKDQSNILDVNFERKSFLAANVSFLYLGMSVAMGEQTMQLPALSLAGLSLMVSFVLGTVAETKKNNSKREIKKTFLKEEMGITSSDDLSIYLDMDDTLFQQRFSNEKSLKKVKI